MKCGVCGKQVDGGAELHNGCEAKVLRMILTPLPGDDEFVAACESDGAALSQTKRLLHVTRAILAGVAERHGRRTVLTSTKIHVGD